MTLVLCCAGLSDFLGLRPTRAVWITGRRNSRLRSRCAVPFTQAPRRCAAFFCRSGIHALSFVYRCTKQGWATAQLCDSFADRAQNVEGPNLEQTKQALTWRLSSVPSLFRNTAWPLQRDLLHSLLTSIQQNSGVTFSASGSSNRPIQFLIRHKQGRALVLRDTVESTPFTTTEYIPLCADGILRLFAPRPGSRGALILGGRAE